MGVDLVVMKLCNVFMVCRGFLSMRRMSMGRMKRRDRSRQVLRRMLILSCA